MLASAAQNAVSTHAGLATGLEHALERLGAMYVLADASSSAAATAITVDAAADAPKRAGGWVAPLADTLEVVLKALQDGLDKLHVPYSYGYSIILLTLIVKIITYPLTKQQVSGQ